MLACSLFARARSVLCIGAHGDDIEIGCGGTLLTMIAGAPDVRVDWVVLSATAERRREIETGASLVCGDSLGRLRIGDGRDGFLPYTAAATKDAFRDPCQGLAPDIVLTHRRRDAHQDHRFLGELTWQTFRDTVILEYEIPKYEGDLEPPNVFVPLDPAVLDHKIAILAEAYASQAPKYWFDPELFRGLARLRGTEARSPTGYAEAFHARKLVVI